jgi:hypothetical protein
VSSLTKGISNASVECQKCKKESPSYAKKLLIAEEFLEIHRDNLNLKKSEQKGTQEQNVHDKELPLTETLTEAQQQALKDLQETIQERKLAQQLRQSGRLAQRGCGGSKNAPCQDKFCGQCQNNPQDFKTQPHTKPTPLTNSPSPEGGHWFAYEDETIPNACKDCGDCNPCLIKALLICSKCNKAEKVNPNRLCNNCCDDLPSTRIIFKFGVQACQKCGGKGLNLVGEDGQCNDCRRQVPNCLKCRVKGKNIVGEDGLCKPCRRTEAFPCL